MKSRGILTPGAAIGQIGLACLAGTLAACQQVSTVVGTTGSSPLPSPPEPLRLGALLPATGPSAAIGQPMLEALTTIVDGVNACGGVNNAAVSLIVEDDPMTPAAGGAATTRLIEDDQVDAVVGALASPVSMAALKVAVTHRIPLISPSSTSPMFTAQAKQGKFQGYWARTIPSDSEQATALATLLTDRGIRTVSTIATNTEADIALEKAFIAAFEKRGGVVLSKAAPIRHNPKGTLYDFDAEATALFNPSGIRPKAVVAILDPQTGGNVFRSAYELGLMEGIQVVLPDRLKLASFAERVGPALNGKPILAGAIGTAPTTKGPAAESLTQLWLGKTGAMPSVYLPQTWDAAALVMLAAQAAKANTSLGIKTHLRDVANPPGVEVRSVCEGLKQLQQGRDINYQGASGSVDLDANGDVVSNYDVWTVTAQGAIDVINQVELTP